VPGGEDNRLCLLAGDLQAPGGRTRRIGEDT
jgi:hypothetical protein